ncbi:MAG: hypothetical protein WCE64_12635, partial [Bacteroidales bacterium]
MIPKNKIKCFLILWILVSWNLNAQWIMEKSNTSDNLNSIFLYGENSAWIVGDNGTMLYRNAFKWMEYPKVTANNLYSVLLLDENQGWAVGSKGTILYFNGSRWENFPSPTAETLFSVSFLDPENGFAVGTNGVILEYIKDSWKVMEQYTRGKLFTVVCKDDISIIGGGLENMSIPLRIYNFNFNKNTISSFDPDYIAIKSLAIA